MDGKDLIVKVENEITVNVAMLRKRGIVPSLSIIRIGENKASIAYSRSIMSKADSLGIYVEQHKLNGLISEKELISVIQKINKRKEINGILIELPLPQGMRQKIVLEIIDPDKDIDGFHPINLGKLLREDPAFVPATAQSIIETIKNSIHSITGKNAVVIGRSNIVGKPVALLLLKENATVTICHSYTKNLTEIAKTADILIVSIGRPKMINKNYIKEGAIVIDAGINKIDGKIVGDVDFDSVQDIVGRITPVPGNIGALTTLILLKNTIRAAKIQNKLDIS
ncbi:MAG: bifunctional 5,10-methylenetetrahydrofolate dehydrogenase/5,10-methenyltetrahydrofolate cyclohydrolase [Caldisericota bacterium]|nr:bifunctional 5,10-methylenetetrahydrofolate dehydrogenase/5,10-methenyltetrahydrofolate cyclohydrolase [Caldisericota bacterium]